MAGLANKRELCVKVIRSHLLSCPEGMTIQQLERNYEATERENLPYRLLGYPNTLAFLQSLNGVVKIDFRGSQIHLQGIADEATKHVKALIDKQKRKRPSSKPVFSRTQTTTTTRYPPRQFLSSKSHSRFKTYPPLLSVDLSTPKAAAKDYEYYYPSWGSVDAKAHDSSAKFYPSLVGVDFTMRPISTNNYPPCKTAFSDSRGSSIIYPDHTGPLSSTSQNDISHPPQPSLSSNVHVGPGLCNFKVSSVRTMSKIPSAKVADKATMTDSSISGLPCIFCASQRTITQGNDSGNPNTSRQGITEIPTTNIPACPSIYSTEERSGLMQTSAGILSTKSKNTGAATAIARIKVEVSDVTDHTWPCAKNHPEATLDMSRDVVGTNTKYQPSKLPVDDDTLIDVFVTHITDPSNFAIQVCGKSTTGALNELMDDMRMFYSSLDWNQYTLSSYMAKVDQICAVASGGDLSTWNRARITKVKCDFVEVLCVDYGTVEIVPVTSLKLLKSCFLSLPTQMINARLSNVLPRNLKSWTPEARDCMRGMCRDKQLSAIVGQVEGGVASICLREISDALVDKQHGVVFPDFLNDVGKQKMIRFYKQFENESNGEGMQLHKAVEKFLLNKEYL